MSEALFLYLHQL